MLPLVLIPAFASSVSSVCVSFSKCFSDHPPEKHMAATVRLGISTICTRLSNGSGTVSMVNSFGITNAIELLSDKTGDVIAIFSETTGLVILTFCFLALFPVIKL